MLINSSSDITEFELKTPILVSLFRALGGLIVLATILLVIASIKTEQTMLSIPAGFIVGGCGGLISLVFFGVAQLLMSIAKIEFYASTQKNQAILRSLHNIENHLESLRKEKNETGA